MKKAGKTKVGAGVAKARAATRTPTRTRQSADTKLAELNRRLLEISDLAAAGAVLRWDQFTYMPRGGAPARARQRATLSRLAHAKCGEAAFCHVVRSPATRFASSFMRSPTISATFCARWRRRSRLRIGR